MATVPLAKSAEAEAAYRAAYDSSLRLWPSGCESRTVPTRFGLTHVIACGAAGGEPVFLLPAMGLSATMWYAVACALAREFRCYGVDFPSDMGLSTCENPPANRSDCVAWLRTVLDALDVARASLVGASYGSFLALNYVIAEPARVHKLVLCSPAAGIVALRKSFYLRMLLSFLLPGRSGADRIMDWVFADRFPHDHPVLRQLMIGAKSLQPRMKVYPKVFTDSELAGTSAPVCFLFGEREVFYNPHTAAERARQIMPKASVKIVPQAGHLLVMECPESVSQDIAAFLRGR
jgi:pimeloyl-ACP methyl ester carboxylesterase